MGASIGRLGACLSIRDYGIAAPAFPPGDLSVERLLLRASPKSGNATLEPVSDARPPLPGDLCVRQPLRRAVDTR